MTDTRNDIARIVGQYQSRDSCRFTLHGNDLVAVMKTIRFGYDRPQPGSFAHLRHD